MQRSVEVKIGDKTFRIKDVLAEIRKAYTEDEEGFSEFFGDFMSEKVHLYDAPPCLPLTQLYFTWVCCTYSEGYTSKETYVRRAILEWLDKKRESEQSDSPPKI